jgi:hypothetical protein
VGRVGTVGLDLATNVFQVQGADVSGAVIFRKNCGDRKCLCFSQASLLARWRWRFATLDAARGRRVVFCEKVKSRRGYKEAPLSGGQRKGLCQILHKLARDPQVRGFKSFREAVVGESEGMAGLIALAAFGEQAGQGHCRSQLPGERRLRACNSERFGQAVHG